MVDLHSDCFSFARCTIYKAPYDVCRWSGRPPKTDSPKTSKPKPAGATGNSPLVGKMPTPKKVPELEPGEIPGSKGEPDKGFKVIEVPGPGGSVKSLKIVRPPGASKAVAKKRTGGGKLKRTSDVVDPAAPSAKKPRFVLKCVFFTLNFLMIEFELHCC